MSNPTFLSWVEGDVRREREAQDQKWGEQNHPDGISPLTISSAVDLASAYRELNDHANPTWQTILLEEVYEAMAEDDPEKLRLELIQVAAVAMTWVEAIDRRKRVDT
jgi:hypothetical protein